MGDKDDRDAAGIQIVKDVQDLLARDSVEVTGRLVGQDDTGFGRQGAGDGNPLLLAARQLVRPVIHPIREPHRPQSLFGPPAPFPTAPAGIHQGQFHLPDGRRSGQQIVYLEYEPDALVSNPRQIIVAHLAHVRPVQPVGPAGGLV